MAGDQVANRERDYQLIADKLRRMMSRTCLKMEEAMDDSDEEHFVGAEVLLQLSHAALYIFYLDCGAANMEAKVKREAN